MPSKKRQVGVRLTPDNEARLPRLREAMKVATGIDVTVTDVVNAALIELEKRYPAAGKERRANR